MDTVCDDDVPVYIVFTTHINLDSAQFFAKPRTYLVSVGMSVLGPPTTDNAGDNITSDLWDSWTILQKIAAYDNRLGIGDTNETGSGIEKTIFVQTTIRVRGRLTAEAYITNNITCDGCLDNWGTVFIAQGFTSSDGSDLLLNISDPYILDQLPFPISNHATPSRRLASAYIAAVAAAVAAIMAAAAPVLG